MWSYWDTNHRELIDKHSEHMSSLAYLGTTKIIEWSVLLVSWIGETRTQRLGMGLQRSFFVFFKFQGCFLSGSVTFQLIDHRLNHGHFLLMQRYFPTDLQYTSLPHFPLLEKPVVRQSAQSMSYTSTRLTHHHVDLCWFHLCLWQSNW